MNPSDRLLSVMEYLMQAGQHPVKQVDIARDLGISAATLNRIIKVLSDNGYLFRTSERFVVPNFRFTKNVPMSSTYMNVLEEIMQELTAKYGIYSEAVVVTGQLLFWHSRTDVPNPSISIRAKAGFRRPLYELDAMSRMYMSRLDWDDIDARFNIRAFHDNRPGLTLYSAEEAKQIIQSHAGRDFAYDFEGNRVGLRRFALMIEDMDGNFLHFLTLAEEVAPVADPKARIEEYHRALLDARERLIAVMETERRAAEIAIPAYNLGRV